MPDPLVIKKILVFFIIALMGILGVAFFVYAWFYIRYNLGKVSYEPLRKIRLVILVVGTIFFAAVISPAVLIGSVVVIKTGTSAA